MKFAKELERDLVPGELASGCLWLSMLCSGSHLVFVFETCG